MTLMEIGSEFLKEAGRIKNKIRGLEPLLMIYRGDDLITLKKRILILHKLCDECELLGEKALYYLP